MGRQLYLRRNKYLFSRSACHSCCFAERWEFQLEVSHANSLLLSICTCRAVVWVWVNLKISEVKFTKSGKFWLSKPSELFIPFSQYHWITPYAPASALGGFLSKFGCFRCTAIIWPVFRFEFRRNAELSLVIQNTCEFRSGSLVPNSNNALNWQLDFFLCQFTARNDGFKLCEMLLFGVELLSLKPTTVKCHIAF